MESVQVKGLIATVLFVLGITVTDVNSQCVSSYQKLEKIFIESDENYGNLSEAFFIKNRINSQYVIVNYRTIQCDNRLLSHDNFTGCTTIGIEQWIWSQSIVHMLFHPYAVSYLSFWYDNTDKRMATVTLTIPAVCQCHRNKLLSRLTQLVSDFL